MTYEAYRLRRGRVILLGDGKECVPLERVPEKRCLAEVLSSVGVFRAVHALGPLQPRESELYTHHQSVFLIIQGVWLPPCFLLFNLVYSANSISRRSPLILENRASVSFYPPPSPGPAQHAAERALPSSFRGCWEEKGRPVP